MAHTQTWYVMIDVTGSGDKSEANESFPGLLNDSGTDSLCSEEEDAGQMVMARPLWPGP